MHCRAPPSRWTKLDSFVSLPPIVCCATIGGGHKVAAQYRRKSRKGEGLMIRTGNMIAAGLMAAALALAAGAANAKDKVKVGFIGPLTGGVSVNGIGGRNSADLAVRLRNADAKAKYEYELVVLDDGGKPNIAVQVATKMAADKEIIAAATHYCSAAAIAAVDTYH